MAMVNSLEAVRKLREAGMDESQAEAVVEVITCAFNGQVTKGDTSSITSEIKSEFEEVKAAISNFETGLHRALWIHGAGIVTVIGIMIAIATIIG